MLTGRLNLRGVSVLYMYPNQVIIGCSGIRRFLVECDQFGHGQPRVNEQSRANLRSVM
jgi:hypothetical protein